MQPKLGCDANSPRSEKCQDFAQQFMPDSDTRSTSLLITKFNYIRTSGTENFVISCVVYE